MIRDRLSSIVRRRAGPLGGAAADVLRGLARTASSSLAERREVRLLAGTIPGGERLRQGLVRRVEGVAGLEDTARDIPAAVVAEPSRRAAPAAPRHAEHLEALVDQRLRQLADHWRFDRAADPVESLHELRVASRRLRALLVTFSDRLDSEAVKGPSRRLRRITRALGPLRELDVAVAQLEELHGVAGGDAERAALEYLLERTERRRKKQRKATLRALGSIKRSRIDAEVRELLPSITSLSDDDVTQIGWTALRASIDAVFDSAPSATGPEAPERMHAMRISMKKLRYTLELLEPALDADFSKLHRRSKTQQELLGDHHDVFVLQSQLAEEARRLGSRGRPALSMGLRRVADHLAQRRIALFSKFRKKRSNLDRESLLGPIRRALHMGEVVERRADARE